jgi:hypothetical protein
MHRDYSPTANCRKNVPRYFEWYLELLRCAKNCRYFVFFSFVWPCIVTNFFTIKPTRCTNFNNLFWYEILHVSDNSCPSSGVYSRYTQQRYISYRFVDSFRAGPGWNSILVLLENKNKFILSPHLHKISSIFQENPSFGRPDWANYANASRKKKFVNSNRLNYNTYDNTPTKY